MGYIFIIHDHLSRGRFYKTGDGTQGRRLTAAWRPKESEKLSFLHVDIDAMQCGEIIKLYNDIIKLSFFLF